MTGPVLSHGCLDNAFDECNTGGGAYSSANRRQAAASFRRLATLDVTVACFGHGEPLTRDATAEFQAAARRLPADAGEHA
jgi:hypothetical protein